MHCAKIINLNKFLINNLKCVDKLPKHFSNSTCLSNSNDIYKDVRRAIEPLEEIDHEPKKKAHWLTYNDIIFPPQTPDEPRRPAYVCHSKMNIHYSPKKMWYVACLVRGMSVEEAIKQLNFVCKKGALYVKDTIEEAQQLAIDRHYVEYKTNLWVAESFVGKGQVLQGMRRHARGRFGKIKYRYCNYYVRLEEGIPPENYYNRPPQDKDSLLNKWIESMRNRRIISSL